MRALTIWLYGLPVATVEEDPYRHRLRMMYTAQALDRFDAGTPLLSLRLPPTTEPYPNAVAWAFLDGLLPEGASAGSSLKNFTCGPTTLLD